MADEVVPGVPSSGADLPEPTTGTERPIEDDIADVLAEEYPEFFQKSEAAPPVGEPVVPPVQPPPTEVPPPTPEAAPVPAAPSVAPEVPPPAPAPVEQPQAQPPAEQQPWTQEQEQQYRQQVATVREQVRQGIESRYTITDEDATAMQEDPKKVVPRLLSHVVMDTYDSVMSTVMAQLPRVIAAVAQQNHTTQTHEAEFFKRWPVLNKPEYSGTVTRIAQTYRQMNPHVPAAQMREEVGAQAVFALGLANKVAAPAQPPTPASAPPRFVPAAVGGVPKSAPPGADNFFAQLSKEFEEL